jgi:macrolide phosphotransferase
LGQSRDSDGTQGYLFTSVEGEDPEPSKLPPGVFSKSLADALVAIHSLNLDVVRSAGLPEFDATAVLHQKVSELDKIAATGRVPAALLSRWESALEDVGLSRFHSTVIHGGLNREAIRLGGQRVAGITAMESMRIADPAEDFTWILGACLPSTVEDILLHYRASRPAADENLLQRATLYSELELGSWLAYCMEHSDEEGIAQAEALIAELRDQQEAGSLRDLRATSFAGLAAGTAMLPIITESIPMVSDATESLTQVQEEPELDAQVFESDAETSIDELFAQEDESEDRPASSDELF